MAKQIQNSSENNNDWATLHIQAPPTKNDRNSDPGQVYIGTYDIVAQEFRENVNAYTLV